MTHDAAPDGAPIFQTACSTNIPPLTGLNTLGWLAATNMPLLPELRRAASNEPPRVHRHDEPQNSGWGLLTELVGLLGCGFYKYGAPDGARNCAVGWARRLPGVGRRFSAFTRWNRTEGALSLMDRSVLS